MDKHNLLNNEEYTNAKKYWEKVLSTDIYDVKIPYDNTTDDSGRNKFTVSIDEIVSMNILDICKKYDLLTFIYLQIVLKIFIYKITGKRNIAVGIPTLDKEVNKIEGLILPCTDNVLPNDTFKMQLKNARDNILTAYKNQFYNIESINNFYETKIIYLRYILSMENLHSIEIKNAISKLKENEIYINFSITDNNINLEINYNSKLFNKKTMESYINSYLYIIKQVSENPNIIISDIEITSNKYKMDENDILDDEDCNIIDLFEKVVDKYPDEIAVSCTYDKDDNENHDARNVISFKSLTYKELDMKSNQLARLIRDNEAKNCVVGILVDRSLELIISILGVLKAGCAYLPMETDYPVNRIKFLLDNSNANIIIKSNNIDFEDKDINTINIDDDSIYLKEVENVKDINKSSDLAYVIYTSGSTGKPKGVMVEHKSIINYARWKIEKYSYDQNDIHLQLLSTAFDAFGANLYTSILSGGELVIVDSKKWRNFNIINKIINLKSITSINIVPSIYKLILEYATKETLKSLKLVILGGEKISDDCISISNKINPNIVLVNEYGPTECTIAVSANSNITHNTKDFLGEVISNCKIYILNNENKLMGNNIQGELCVSGKPLARGYINDNRDISSGFVKHPFIPNEKLYRTGDLAKRYENGNIELMGRIDNQIKIRGYRISLEEIESQILNIPYIKEAVVVVKYDLNSIYAFVTSSDKVNSNKIKEELSLYLPQYMIPSGIIHIESLPLTANGKIDRDKLHSENITYSMDLEEKEPQNCTEKRLAKIWKDVLKIDYVSTNSNFFEIGGNSILLMQVYAQVEKEFIGEFNITDMFSNPTIITFAKLIDEYQKNIDIDSFILPKDYFKNASNSKKNEFIFRFPDILRDRMQAFLNNEHVDYIDILLSSYIYLFSKVCNREKITIGAIISKKNQVDVFTIQMDLIQTFFDLIHEVHKKRESEEYMRIEANKYFCKNVELKVVPMILYNHLLAETFNPLDLWDISYVIDKDDPLTISCKYNNRLSEQKIGELMNLYISIINQIINQNKETDFEK